MTCGGPLVVGQLLWAGILQHLLWIPCRFQSFFLLWGALLPCKVFLGEKHLHSKMGQGLKGWGVGVRFPSRGLYSRVVLVMGQTQSPKPSLTPPRSQVPFMMIVSPSSRKVISDPSARAMGFWPFHESSRRDPNESGVYNGTIAGRISLVECTA